MLLNKINGLGVLLFGISMLLLINLLFHYVGLENENSFFATELSDKKVTKFKTAIIRSLNNSKPNSENSTAILNKPTSRKFVCDELEQGQNKPCDASATADDKFLSLAESDRNSSDFILPVCKEVNTANGGPIIPNTTLESLDVVEAELAPFLRKGGAYLPSDCIPKYHVGIIVPFRDRYAHLSVFLRNIHPFLMKQRIAYQVFVVEQTNGKAFNRAAMMNIGFLEALKFFQWDCFIFHDVDLLPLDDRNVYNCPRQPRHMSVAIDTLNFRLPYKTIFGGVSAMSQKHFKSVNGFSNSYYGWGGEDDDMFNRLRHAKLFISRYPVNVARYMMLKHQKEKANPKRYENLLNGINKMEMDGLNSIKYDIYGIKEYPLFTWYLAELKLTDTKS